MRPHAKGIAVAAAAAWLALAASPSARASCASPANAIEAENCLPGTPESDWDPPAADPSIAGFATQASVNPGSTISFKINTNAANYTLSIYRMGYYGGDGARLVTTLSPSVPLPQSQPSCLTDTSTGLIDCGNWAVSASWAVPSTATSGIYFVELLRPDTGGTNIFSFVVRNDASHSAIVYQMEDTTQQAYNDWGGNSLYVGNPAGRAYKVSFNRPPDNEGTLWDMFEFETSIIRWMEMNSYDMTYISGIDADRDGALLLNHKVFLSVGHDEYWSGAQRANVEAAIAAGVNMAFFSGNTMFWKTRWENSIDGSNTDHRTLVCYKETTAGARIDPEDPPTSTGLWADPMFGPPLSDGGRSESLDLGAAGDVYGPSNRDDTMNVPAAYGKDRFWRNTSLATMAPGATTSYPQMLGYEWDEYVVNQGFPAGFIELSSTTLSVPDHLGANTSQDYTAGTAAHHLILYRAPSGALVFDAGTMQWGWYLDDNHWIDVDPVVTPDPNIQQATVNLFADMGVQPGTLQSGLVPATKSTDTLPPASLVLTPAETFTKGALATVSGTAVDFGGGIVAGVEVSTDNGVDWFPAQGLSNWSYSWTPATTAIVAARSRATDDSGNVEGLSAGNPAPILNSVAPSSAAAGAPGFNLSVLGSNFVSSSTLLWNGSSRATVFVSSTRLTAAILASDLAAGTTASVTVASPSPGGGVSTAAVFLVENPAPSLTALSVSSAAAGGPGFILGVSGSNFVSSSTVRWNGSSRATVFVSSTQLTASILAGDLTAPTTAGVTVFAPGPGGGATAAAPFVVYLPPTPVVFALAPSSAAAGSAGISLGVIGANFTSGTTVLWNGSNRATVFVSTALLTAQILAGDLAAPTTALVAVFSAAGGTSTAASFLVYAPVQTGPPPPTQSLFYEGFNYPNGLITNEFAHWNPTSTSAVISSTWDMTSGSLFAKSGQGWTGVPDDVDPNAGSTNGTDSAIFRLTTKRANFGDVSVLMTLNQSTFVTTANTPSATDDGVNVALRLTSSTSYYYFSASRRDNTVVIKKIVGSNETTLASAAHAFALGSPQLIEADVHNSTGGAVALSLEINGTQYLSYVDTGTAGAPLSSSGAVGVSGDNAEFLFGAFTVNAYSTGPAPNPAPSLSALSPSSATAGSPGFNLTLSGSNFISSSTVRWNGLGLPTVFVSSSQLLAAVPSADLASSTAAAVTVFNPAPGGGASAAQNFKVYSPNPVPGEASISPSSAAAGTAGLTLSVFGSGFVSSSTVLWNGASRTTVFVSSGQLNAQLTSSDLAASTTASVAVFSPAPGGGVSSTQTFVVTPAPPGIPTLSSISPSSAAAGGLGFTLNAFGGGFTSRSTVLWNGASRATVFVSSGQLSAQILAADLMAATTAAVAVFTPAPGGGTSTAKTFLIYPPNPAPALTSISPSSASAGTAGLTLSVFGTGFVSSSTVLWNGANRATVFISSGQLSAQLTSSDLAVSTTAAVAVFSPAPGGGFSSSQTFVVTPAPPGVPALASISPSSAAAGGLGFTLNAFGGGFVSSSTVMWNGAARATVFVSSGQLSAQILAADIIVAATAAVTVFTPSPGGGASTARAFLVYSPNPVPTLAAIAPSSASAGTSGLNVNVLGAGFVSSSTVRWNGANRVTVFVSSGQLNALLTPSDLAVATTAAVTVFSPAPGGGFSSSQTFVVTPAPPGVPTLASISPSSGAVGGAGFTLNVLGSGFISSSTVLWNGSSRATVFVSGSQLSADILAGDLAAPTTAQVTVFNPGPGGGTSTAAGFVVEAATSSAPAALFDESFNYRNGLITNEYAHWNPTSTSSVISSTWDMTSGSLFAENGEGWTGAPDDVSPNSGSTNGTDSAIFRLTTKRANFGDVSVAFSLNQQSFITTAGTPSSDDDGVNVALRLTSSTSYYYVSASRRDSTVTIKKTLGSTETTLASAAHVATLGSAQQIEADVHNSTGGAVTLSLEINGALVLSFVDSGTGGVPLTSSGAVGVSGDNANFYFSNFVVAAFASAGSHALGAPASASPLAAADLSGVRVYPNPWRVDLHQGHPIMVDNSTPGSQMRIFTVSGRWVRTIPLAGDGTGSWDLNNSGGQRVASGTYFYLITDGQGHQSRGALAVIQ